MENSDRDGFSRATELMDSHPLWTASAAGLAIGHSIVHDIPSIVVVISLWVFIRAAISQNGPLSAFGVGAICGGLSYVVASGWVVSALAHSGAPLAAAGIFWLITVLACGALPIGGLAFALRSVGRLPILGACVSIAAISYSLDRVATSTAIGLPSLAISYAVVSDSGISQFACVAGSAGLSSLIITTAYFLARFEKTPEAHRALGAVAAIFLVVPAVGLPFSQAVREHRALAQGRSIDLLFIQPDLPQSERWLPEMQPLLLQQLIDFSRESIAARPEKPDALVWPENVITAPIDENIALQSGIAQFVNDSDISLIAGLVERAPFGVPNAYRSSVLWFSPGESAVSRTHKSIAVPIVESNHTPFWARGLLHSLGSIASWPRVVTAELVTKPLAGAFEVAPLLCYEALFPAVVAARRGPETVAIINLADDGWIGLAAASSLMAKLARLRAIEQRLPLIRLSQGGNSFSFDEFGTQQQTSPPGEFAAFSVRVDRTRPPSLLERGAIFAATLAPGLVAWMIFPTLRRWFSGSHSSGTCE